MACRGAGGNRGPGGFPRCGPDLARTDEPRGTEIWVEPPACRRNLLGDLHAAAYDGDLEAVLRLLQDGAQPDERDDRGFTPLLWSCLRGAVTAQGGIAASLISAGADPNAVTMSGESNCLIWAVEGGALDLIQVLLDRGALVNNDADGVTPLMVAAREGNAAVVALLLRGGADPRIDCGGYGAAAYARHGGHEDVAELLDQALTN
jgi:ankyrin repeat protein